MPVLYGAGNFGETFDLGRAYSQAEDVKTSQQMRQMRDLAMQSAGTDEQERQLQHVLASIEWALQSPSPAKALLGDPKAVQAFQAQGVDLSTLDDNRAREMLMLARGRIAAQLRIRPDQQKPRAPELRTVGNEVVRIPEEGDPEVVYTGKPTPRQEPETKPVLANVTLPDGSTQQQWVLPGQSAGTPVGSPKKDAPSIKDSQGLRKEFRTLPAVKAFEETLPLLVSARNAPDNGYGDLQLIYTAGKLLDPGSVVREGEVALAIAAGSPIQRAIGITQFNAEAGGRLTATARKQLLGMLNERVLSYRQAYERDRNEYRRYAAEQGLNPNDVIGTHPTDAYQQKPKAQGGKIIKHPSGATVEIISE